MRIAVLLAVSTALATVAGRESAAHQRSHMSRAIAASSGRDVIDDIARLLGLDQRVGDGGAPRLGRGTPLHSPFDGFGNTGGVVAFEERLAELPVPSIVRVHDSALGDTDASTLFSSKVQRLVNGVVVDDTVPQHPGARLRDLFDVLLYLGPRSSMTRTIDTPEQLTDTAFVRELDRRSNLQFGHPFRPTTAQDRCLFP